MGFKNEDIKTIVENIKNNLNIEESFEKLFGLIDNHISEKEERELYRSGFETYKNSFMKHQSTPQSIEEFNRFLVLFINATTMPGNIELE